MTRVIRLRRGIPETLALLLILGLGIAGCSSDDGDFLEMPTAPDGNTGNTGGTGGDQFSETLAGQQAVGFAEQLIAMVQSLPEYAEGFAARSARFGLTLPSFAVDRAAKEGELGFAWNETSGRWEFRVIFSDEGFYMDLYASVRFQDDQGQPLQEPDGAERMIYHEDATLEVDLTEGDEHLVSNMYGSAELVMSGLQSATRNLTGSASQDIEYLLVSPARNESLDTTIAWEILTGGLDLPLDGCPAGTIRYTLPPYRLDLVFDGAGTAAFTLYDEQNSVIPEGTGTQVLTCGS